MCIPAGNFLQATAPLIASGTESLGDFQPTSIGGVGGINTPGETRLTSTFFGSMTNLIEVPPDYLSSLGTISGPPLVGSTGHTMIQNPGKPWGLRAEELGTFGSGP